MTDEWMSPDGQARCFGNRPGQDVLAHYHDTEWGVPVHDDRHLFEMLTLEGAQAGLSWEVVLKKRDGYRAAFHDFDIAKVAAMSDEELLALRDNPAIVRNRLKIESTRSNARALIRLQAEQESFSRFLWDFVGGTPVVNHFASLAEVPASTALSDQISKALKAAGFRFVGSTIIYAFIQGIGMVDDHVATCWCRSSGREASS